MSKIGDMVKGAVDILTLLAMAAVAFSVGGIVVFNIATSLPPDPIFEEMRCFVSASFKGDEKCFAKKLEAGLTKLSAEFEIQKTELESAHKARERELDEMMRKKGEEVAALEVEKTGISKTRGELEAQLKKLEDLEKASTSFTLFTAKPWKNGITVQTGVSYASFVKHQEWTNSWCYMQVSTKQGVSINLSLGSKMAGGETKGPEVSAAELSAVQMTTSDIEDARKFCAFPGAGA